MRVTLDLDELELQEIVLALEQQRLTVDLDEQARFAVLLEKVQAALGGMRPDQGASSSAPTPGQRT